MIIRFQKILSTIISQLYVVSQFYLIFFTELLVALLQYIIAVVVKLEEKYTIFCGDDNTKKKVLSTVLFNICGV